MFYCIGKRRKIKIEFREIKKPTKNSRFFDDSGISSFFNKTSDRLG
jgi:hypothetical protein